VAGGASLAAGTSADAQIVHTEVNQYVPATTGASSYEVSIAGAGVAAWGGFAPGGFQPGAESFAVDHLNATGGFFFARTNGGFAKNYAVGAAITGANFATNIADIRAATHNANGNWSTFGNFGAAVNSPTRAGAVTGFLGFETGGPNHDKGWIQVSVGPNTSAGYTNSASTPYTIIDYAYNSSGGPINAGQTSSVPEPGTMALALMAAGAAGIASIRRARAKFVNDTQPAVEPLDRADAAG
jgi:hypothetical protein